MVIHFSRNPRNGASPPIDRSDVNIMKFVRVVSLFVLRIWLMNDVLIVLGLMLL